MIDVFCKTPKKIACCFRQDYFRDFGGCKSDPNPPCIIIDQFLNIGNHMAHTPHIPAPFQLRLALHCVMQLPVNGLGLLAPDCSSWGVPARGTSKRSPINVFGNIFLQWVQDSGCMVARRHACTRHPSMGCGTIMSYTSDQRLPEDCITYIGHYFPECTVGLGAATWVTS